MNTITPEPVDHHHSFHAVAESFLQADGLPFTDVLSAQSIEQVFSPARRPVRARGHLLHTDRTVGLPRPGSAGR